MATIFQGGKVIGRIPRGTAAAGGPVLEMMERGRRRAGILDEEEETDGEYEPLLPGGRPLKGSGTPVGEEIPRLGSESQQDELRGNRDRMESGLQERRDRLAQGMGNTRTAISGDTSFMGQSEPSVSTLDSLPSSFAMTDEQIGQAVGGQILDDTLGRVRNLRDSLTAIKPRFVSDSIIDMGNSIERNMIGQPAIDRQLSAKFGNIARGTTDSFIESQSEVLDIPFEEENDDFGFDALDDESMFASSPTSDLDYDFSIA